MTPAPVGRGLKAENDKKAGMQGDSSLAQCKVQLMQVRLCTLRYLFPQPQAHCLARTESQTRLQTCLHEHVDGIKHASGGSGVQGGTADMILDTKAHELEESGRVVSERSIQPHFYRFSSPRSPFSFLLSSSPPRNLAAVLNSPLSPFLPSFAPSCF